MLVAARLVALLLAVGIWVLLSSGPAAAQTTVDVSLSDPGSSTLPEWAAAPDPPSAPAGTITFEVTNVGVIEHNLRVIKTDLPPDGLPISGSQVDESAVDVVASVPNLAADESDSTTADLPVGNYVLICNVPNHYLLGQFSAFQVTSAPTPTDTPPAGETPTTVVETPAAETPGAETPAVETPAAATETAAAAATATVDVSAFPVTGAGPGDGSRGGWWELSAGLAAVAAALFALVALRGRRSER